MSNFYFFKLVCSSDFSWMFLFYLSCMSRLLVGQFCNCLLRFVLCVMQSQAFNKLSARVLSAGNREGLSGKIIMCAAFFTPLATVFTLLLQVILGPGIFFSQFLLMTVISKKNYLKCLLIPLLSYSNMKGRKQSNVE